MTSFSERLVQQLLKMHQREGEVEREHATLREKEEHRDSMRERLQQLKDQVLTVDSVRSALEQLNREAEEKYAEARREDEAERQRLSKTLQETINAVNAYSEDVMQLEVKSQNEHRSLKEQLEIYATYRASGQDKYDEIMKAREAEYAKIEEKRNAAREMKPALEKALAEETEALVVARAEHMELQEEVNKWVNRLSEIHERLMKARGSFENAKSDKERQLRRIRSLESDRQMMIQRAEKSKMARDTEHVKVTALREKIEVMKKQTDKLLAVVTMLEDDK